MKIFNDIANEFRRAIVDRTNLLADGSVNWDFVEADVLISVGIDNVLEEMGSITEFYSYFNELVELQLSLEVA